jgi:hypothetical protein
VVSDPLNCGKYVKKCPVPANSNATCNNQKCVLSANSASRSTTILCVSLPPPPVSSPPPPPPVLSPPPPQVLSSPQVVLTASVMHSNLVLRCLGIATETAITPRRRICTHRLGAFVAHATTPVTARACPRSTYATWALRLGNLHEDPSIFHLE